VSDGHTKVLDAVGGLAAESRWTVVELTPERRDLEDIFRRLQERRHAPEPAAAAGGAP
jgi:hypothetical protein